MGRGECQTGLICVSSGVCEFVGSFVLVVVCRLNHVSQTDLLAMTRVSDIICDDRETTGQESRL